MSQRRKICLRQSVHDDIYYIFILYTKNNKRRFFISKKKFKIIFYQMLFVFLTTLMKNKINIYKSYYVCFLGSRFLFLQFDIEKYLVGKDLIWHEQKKKNLYR